MNAALNSRLTSIARHAETLGHGEKTPYFQRMAEELGMSLDTLYRKMKSVRVTAPRRKRTDAGATALPLAEAQVISTVLMESMRRNGKRIMTVERAVDMLRANNEIRAERFDEETGEVFPLSTTTITRALRHYKLHPDQLLAPTPHTPLRSLHPNHCWQIDPSLCVLFYLPKRDKDSGLRIMREDQFYKNKPGNLKKIERDRVWRYVITDHYSGCLFVHYVFGGETSENICEALIRCMQPKVDITLDPFRGVPQMVMLDPGSANTSASFNNLCRQLGITVQINKPGNPRAKGQVENGNNLVETHFESGLRFIAINDIDQLNGLAGRWMRFFNGQREHSRHGMTRYSAWQGITGDQLILPPPADYCRELAISAPQERKVRGDLTISFNGNTFDVSAVPNVMVAEKLLVAKNPWQPDAAQVLIYDEEQRESWLTIEPLVMTDGGFRADAPVIGEEYKTPADTPATANAKVIDKLAMGADTLQEAEAARKAKTLPLGGRIDPYAHQEQVLASSRVQHFPRNGTQMDYNKMEVTEQKLNLVEAAKVLKPRIEAASKDWPQALAWLHEHYCDGVPSDAIDGIVAELTRPKLRIVKTG